MSDKETILMGMSGGIYSYVSAFLLKKQGYKIILTSILFPPDTPEHQFFKNYYISDLKSIKQFANELSVPFYGINAQEVFKDKILETIISAKLSGSFLSYKQYETKVIFDLLIEKADLLGATKVSTAHYAKSIFNRKFGCYQLHTGNEVESDHSFYLSSLTEKQLSRCYFPLADMKKSEILKVYSMMGGKAKEYPQNINLNREEQFLDLIQMRSPESLRKTGNFELVHNGTDLGEHNGIHLHFLGEKKLKTAQGIKLDSELEVLAINTKSGKISVGHSSLFRYKYLMLRNLQITAAQNISAPITGFMKCEQFPDKFFECSVYFKNNQVCEVELPEEQKGVLFKGQHIVIYDKLKGNSRIILSANLAISGVKINGKITATFINEDEEKEESSKPQNTLNFL